ncbi:MAG: T9SS type A sorting domain-containing protein [Bacteroidia bacterium]
MKKIFTCLCSLTFLTVSNTFLKAQAVQYLHQIIVANGGVFEFGPTYNDRATVATFNPQTNSYTIFDTIEVESVQDVIIDSIYAYVAAQDSIVKYNLNTYQREAIAYFPNIKKLEIAGNYLMVGKWFGGGDYFAVFNKHNLQEIFSISQVNETVNGMALLNDTFYVAYNIKGTIDLFPPWGVYADSIGKLAVIHASSQTFLHDIILGPNAAGAGKSFVYNNSIYTICIETGYLFKYTPTNGNIDSLNIGIIKYANLHNGILYGDFFTGFGAYNLNTNAFLSNPSFSYSSMYAAINYDFMNNHFYVTETDYSTYGKLYKINNSGLKTDSVNVGISPEAMALDFRLNVSINEIENKKIISAYPNPFNNSITLQGRENASVEVYDLKARLIYQTQSLSNTHLINTENWESGMYIIKVQSNTDVQTLKMIKQ